MTAKSFAEEYADLIDPNAPRRQLPPVPDDVGSDIPSALPVCPPAYQRKFIHTPGGFANNYCIEYDTSTPDEP